MAGSLAGLEGGQQSHGVAPCAQASLGELALCLFSVCGAPGSLHREDSEEMAACLVLEAWKVMEVLQRPRGRLAWSTAAIPHALALSCQENVDASVNSGYLRGLAPIWKKLFDTKGWRSKV